MDEIKKNIKWFILIGVVILLLIVYGIISYINGKKIYNSGLLGDEKVPYVQYNYGDNEYKVITKDKEDMIVAYYNEFLDKYLNDPKALWSILTEENKKKMFSNNYDLFLEYRDNHSTIYSKDNEVIRYNYKEGDNYNTIKVEDSEEYIYTFYEYGVWKFDIEINNI